MMDAERAAHPYLSSTQDPEALTGLLLPVLTKPWPAACLAAAKAAEAAPPRSLDASASGQTLPLLRQDEVVDSLVQCPSCKRMLLRDAFQKHKAVCVTLPVTELLEADAALEFPGGQRHNDKSPSRDLLGRPPSASGGRSHHAVAGGARPPSGGSVGSNEEAAAAMAAPQAKRRQSGSRPSTGRHTARQPSADAEQRRLQYERGLLTVDNVCGVPNGEKSTPRHRATAPSAPCRHPLREAA